jgi:K+/H+ antiporter YhaU regulatory subunit KhtT
MAKDYNNMACRKKNCKDDPVFKCECSDPPLDYCDQHMEVHLKKPGNHNSKASNKPIITPSLKKTLIVSFKNCLHRCKASKDLLIEESNRTIEKILKETAISCEKLKETELKYSNSIEFLKNESYSNTHAKDIERFVYKYIENHESIEKDFDILNEETNVFSKVFAQSEYAKKHFQEISSQFEENKQSQIKTVEALQAEIDLLKKSQTTIDAHTEEINLVKNYKVNINELKAEIDLLKAFNEYSDYGMRYTDYTKLVAEKELASETYNATGIVYIEGKTLVNVNIQNKKDTKTVIPEPIDSRAGYCELPNNQIFCSGANSFHTIDITQNILTKKLNKKQVFYTHCCYNKGSVYLLRDSIFERYDLAQESFTSLQNFQYSYRVSSIVAFRNEVLFAEMSYNTCLYIYNIDSNTYKSVNLGYDGMSKLICKGLGKIFVLGGSNIYESDCFNTERFSQIPSSGFSESLLGCCVRNKLNVYFLLQNKMIYRFNLLGKGLFQVRSVVFG